MYSRFNRLCAFLLHTLLLFAVSGASASVALAQDGATRKDSLKLLAPIGGTTTITIQSGIGTWLEYFQSAYGWIYEIAVGICIIWMLIGGIMIMTSGDQADKRQKGITQMKASITGLLVFIFAGPILRFLNSMFFT